MHIQKESVFFWARVLLCAILLCLGAFVFTEEAFPWWVNLIVFLLAYAIIAYDIVFEMFESMVKEHHFFEESTLMVLASVGAFCLRAFGPEYHEYLEGVLVILLFQIGEHLQELAEEKSRSAIVSALDLREELALVENEDGTLGKKKAEELAPGDVVVLKTGEKSLCDAVVCQGGGAMDESSLTGESLPVEKQEGDAIFAGSIVASGSFRARVAKPYEESTSAKLLALIEESAASKSKTTRFITRFSRVYTPIVFVLALLVAIVPPLFVGNWASFVYAALSFLVVSCPCAIVISVPLAYFAGLGLASKKGILVKGAGFLDQAASLRTVAFDKTGTLTEGRFSLVKIAPISMSEPAFMEAFAIAESRSNHPIAKAIAAAAPEIPSTLVERAEETAGFGTKVFANGHVYEAGRAPKDDARRADSEQGVLVYLAIDGIDQGYLVLRDAPKEGSYSAIQGLKAKNIDPLLLSGDRKENVAAFSEALGIERYYGELKPAEKTQKLREEMKEAQGAVAFVGDGINDAPSIVLADIGFAMGGLGSDVAVENADVVLLGDDPRSLLDFLDVAAKTRRRAAWCVGISLFVKFSIMVASLVASFMGTWSIPLSVSVFGDSGIALVCVLIAVNIAYTGKKKA